ncbi:uncharacterized protein LOC142331140 [Lycorma delicatula]|uniref:uncharacterized protein LOC142331140 n=1 Tax=Lycorma delicatula TaxID=130591 RepID=UPI003F50F25B
MKMEGNMKKEICYFSEEEVDDGNLCSDELIKEDPLCIETNDIKSDPDGCNLSSVKFEQVLIKHEEMDLGTEIVNSVEEDAENLSKHLLFSSDETNVNSHNLPQVNGADNETKVYCSICLVRFENPLEHSNHDCCERDDIIRCKCCAKLFITEKDISNHFKENKSNFSCDACNKTFCGSICLELHCCSLGKINKSNSLYINKRLQTCTKKISDEELMQQNRDVWEYRCKCCNKRFKSESNLREHFSEHNYRKRFTCSYCPKSFDRKWNLMSHVNIHTKEKTYMCDFCQKCFSRKRSLKKHVNSIHYSEKKFICSICQKSFDDIISLTYHLDDHAEFLMFTCNICGKSFNKKGNLKRHFNTHQKEVF